MTTKTRASAESAVERLLQSDEPAIRYLTRRDVLGGPADDDESRILDGPKVTALLSGQQPDGGFPGQAARGWRSTLWRMIALVELGIPPDEPRALAAASYLLDWLLDLPRHRRGPVVINGLPRTCAAGEGAALVIGSRLGMTDDPRVRTVAKALLDWQWPDGGWNCHRNASGRRSTFHESLTAAWGLHEYAQATGDTAADEASHRAVDLFLDHRLFYSTGTGIPNTYRPNPPPEGAVINPRWLKLGYPSYWHYDILAVLLLLARLGRATDRSAREAVDLLEAKRRPDGLWAADRQWWQPSESRFKHQYEVVDWGEAGVPSEMITLNVLRILRSAGRLRTEPSGQ